ncbi:MAG: DUF997 family protein [Verrucomicrobiota bacterium]
MKDLVYEHSKREIWGILILWGCFALWVMTATAQLGYHNQETVHLELVMGFPAWVFWGIALPWLVANVAIILFVCWFMADDSLDIDTAHIESPTLARKGECPPELSETTGSPEH